MAAFVSPLPVAGASAARPASVDGRPSPRCCAVAASATATRAAPPPAPQEAPKPVWHKRLRPGAVVEYYASSAAHMATIVEVAERSLLVEDGERTLRKVALGDVISVWSTPLSAEELAEAVRQAELLLSRVELRDAVRVLHAERARGRRAQFNAAAAGRELFPDAAPAAATIAASRALSAAQERFARHRPGEGWRARPDAVVKTREADAFVRAVKARLGGGELLSAADPHIQRLELCAASSTQPDKALRRVLAAAGYDESAEGATKLLHAIGHWERAPKGKGVVWTFTPEVLDAARAVRDEARRRRHEWVSGNVPDEARRDLRGKMVAYCVDNRDTNFLDDALSVHSTKDSKVVRVWVHIADVASHIESGSTLDVLARQRAQSMYLPLRPLHMLPPPAMDACSFSESFPTEAVTVQMDYNVEERTLVATEVFPSLVPGVKRISFDDYDRLLASESRAMPNLLAEEHCRNLRVLARIAPQLAGSSRRSAGVPPRPRRHSGVSSVRLVRDKSSAGGARRAQVKTYRESGAHLVVGDMLTAAGAALREEARRRGVALPEAPSAARYTRRCGTAPMRKYADLAAQRQVMWGVRGLPAAGADEMIALRTWLHQRRDEAAGTVKDRQSAAIVEAFADRCAQQMRMTGHATATVQGKVGHVAVSRRGALRLGVRIEGGMECMAEVADEVRDAVRAWVRSGVVDEQTLADDPKKAETAGALTRIAMRKLFPVGAAVQMRVDSIDRTTRELKGTVLAAADPEALNA